MNLYTILGFILVGLGGGFLFPYNIVAGILVILVGMLISVLSVIED